MRTLLIVLACALPIHGDSEIRAIMHQYVAAWLSGNSDAVMHLLTDDAVFIPTDKAAYVGAAAIRNYWFSAGGFALTRFSTTIEQVITSGDMATVRGTQVIEWTSNGERWRTHGNYLTVLRRLPSGWRIAWQMAGNAQAERF